MTFDTLESNATERQTLGALPSRRRVPNPASGTLALPGGRK
jgi:hypothetical protein